MIPTETIERVREAADLRDVLRGHVKLRRFGSDWRGPCPLHRGQRPNFVVTPRKQIFHCFVCGEAGDVFAFFMKHLGMDYPTAVKHVGGKVGIDVQERKTWRMDPRAPLYTAMSVAADTYRRAFTELEEGHAAREYLDARGVSYEEACLYGLGYAPDNGEALLDRMRSQGVRAEALASVGLTKEERPKFWRRILFPVRDKSGRIVAFSGRVYGDGEPKYLNSPNSTIFKKRETLLNLYEAKRYIRERGRAVVVEGNFDVLSLDRIGVHEVVAPLGSSLTSEQAKELARFTDRAVLVYDSDKSGIRASYKAADVLLREGLQASIARLPPSHDPDSYARSRGDVSDVLGNCADVLEWKLGELKARGYFDSLEGRHAALEKLLPTIAAARNPVTRDLYVGWTSESLNLKRSIIEREVYA